MSPTRKLLNGRESNSKESDDDELSWVDGYKSFFETMLAMSSPTGELHNQSEKKLSVEEREAFVKSALAEQGLLHNRTEGMYPLENYWLIENHEDHVQDMLKYYAERFARRESMLRVSMDPYGMCTSRKCHKISMHILKRIIDTEHEEFKAEMAEMEAERALRMKQEEAQIKEVEARIQANRRSLIELRGLKRSHKNITEVEAKGKEIKAKMGAKKSN